MRIALALGAAVVALSAGTAQAAFTGDKIKIGVLNDGSGVYADTSGQGGVIAAKLAAQDVGGNVNGTPIEVVYADHQNKPDVGANIARQWIDTDGVDIIIDVNNSAVALAVNEVAREKNKPFIDSGAGSSDLTGPKCSPDTIHWTYDNWSLAHGTGKTMVQQGNNTWFFITADYAFGHDLQKQTAAVVEANGGKVLGSVNVPLSTPDFSSFLLQAQSSGSKVIGLANAGGDTVNSVKQAHEFGIVQGGQQLAALLMFTTDVHGLGLETAQGLVFTTAFYWDFNDTTRAFAKKIAEGNRGIYPTMDVAGVYGGTLAYLKALKELGDDSDGKKVVDKMKSMEFDDPLFGKVKIRQDGRAIHDMYLMEVKKPAESKYPWDYEKVRAKIPADEAFRPLNEGNCPLVKG